MNIPQKTNYSMLFDSISTSATSPLTSLLSDYSSIKNGSYGKLLKAYYAKDNTPAKSAESKKLSQDKTSEYETTAKAADAVSAAADKLIAKGADSLFKEKDIVTKDEDGKEVTKKGYDFDAIYSAVKSFTDSYNSFINKAKDSTNDNIAREGDNLANQVNISHSQLAKVGITINDDDTLTIDEARFKSADIGSLKSLFNGNQSWAYQVSSKVSMIGSSASSAANSAKNYTNSGSYADSYSVGNLLNSIV